ncbi:hypothetical protein PRUB_a4278 [Pseudoalteromonas rubra]|uniref:Uncharacterized protein n=1 Tax=Pseudoalteromonas rubra TaxID=43658 RepID=A0A8T0C4N1_9GAMM|nr:hypothetical protein PRUB_a4278 [Pseudoalteromonas rubra]
MIAGISMFSVLIIGALVLSCLCPVVLVVMFILDYKKRQLW